MPHKQFKNQKKRIADALLSLMETNGYELVSMSDVARKAGISEKTISRLFASPLDILIWFFEDLNSSITPARQHNHWRDHLFDILMDRFDMMNAHKKTLCSLPLLSLKNPSAAKFLSKSFYQTIKVMVQKSRAPSPQLCEAMLSVAYLSLFSVFQKDDTRDLAKTMAAVDHRLGLIEKALAR